MAKTRNSYRLKIGRPFSDVRLERFCHEIVKGASPHVAAVNAGYPEKMVLSNDYGQRILDRDHVQRRIEEIKDAVIAIQGPPREDPPPSEIDDEELERVREPDWALREAISTYEAAKAQRNPGVMLKTLEMIARLTGADPKKKGRPSAYKTPNTGDEKDESKPKPRVPIDLTSIAEAVGGFGIGPGDESEEEDASDDDVEDGDTEI